MRLKLKRTHWIQNQGTERFEGWLMRKDGGLGWQWNRWWVSAYTWDLCEEAQLLCLADDWTREKGWAHLHQREEG